MGIESDSKRESEWEVGGGGGGGDTEQWSTFVIVTRPV